MTENLKALLMGIELNPYQKSLAQNEYDNLIKIIESQKTDLKWNTETYNKLRDEANKRGDELLKLKMEINSLRQVHLEIEKQQQERIDNLEEQINNLEKDVEYWEEKAKGYYDML